MSIVELSKSVDKLAQAVNSKNKELDELKEKYNEKIRLFNEYIDQLINASNNHDLNGKEIKQLNDEDFFKVAHCNKCKQPLTSIEDYIIVPKAHIKEIIKSEEIAQKFKKLEIEQKINHTPTQLNSTTASNQKKSKSKSKKVCSFCKEAGHTRAKCRIRLATPVGEPKPKVLQEPYGESSKSD